MTLEACIEVFESELLKALQPCANALGINGPVSYLLATELATLGKPVEALTLGEISAAMGCVNKHYRAVYGQ